MIKVRKIQVDTNGDSFDKPLIKVDWDAPKDNELRQLQEDALSNVVDLEVLVLEMGMDRSELGVLVNELKLRLFGSNMAGF